MLQKCSNPTEEEFDCPMPDLTTLDPEYHVVYKCGGQLEYHPYEDDIRTAVTYISL